MTQGMTRVQANLLLLVVALIWGSAFVAQSTAMAHVGPMTFTGLRFLIGAAVVLPWALREWRFLGARQLRPGRGDALQIAGLGGLLWLGAVMQQIGIIGTTVTNAGFLTALYVPLVPLLAWWWLGRRPHASVWPASVGCLVGTWMLSGAGQVQLQTGDLWVIASALPWAVHVLYVGRVADRMAAPFLLACGQFLVCGLVSLAWAVASESVSAAALGAAARGHRLHRHRLGGHRLHRAGDRPAQHRRGGRSHHPVVGNRVCGPVRLCADGRPAQRPGLERLRADPGLHPAGAAAADVA
jgi:drug/metabolite transporter (DMT)-like permease